MEASGGRLFFPRAVAKLFMRAWSSLRIGGGEAQPTTRALHEAARHLAPIGDRVAECVMNHDLHHITPLLVWGFLLAASSYVIPVAAVAAALWQSLG